MVKKRKIEISVSFILSLLAWIYFAVYSKKLDGYETIFVTGVILLMVFTVGFVIRKYSKKNEKN